MKIFITFSNKVKNFLWKLFVECKKSPKGQHQWTEPILQDSIDKDRKKEIDTSYCKYCFKSKMEYELHQEMLKRQIHCPH